MCRDDVSTYQSQNLTDRIALRWSTIRSLRLVYKHAAPLEQRR